MSNSHTNTRVAGDGQTHLSNCRVFNGLDCWCDCGTIKRDPKECSHPPRRRFADICTACDAHIPDEDVSK